MKLPPPSVGEGATIGDDQERELRAMESGGVPDATLRTMRRKMLRTAQNAAEWDWIYQQSYSEAVAHGHLDPADYARSQAEHTMNFIRSERRKEATLAKALRGRRDLYRASSEKLDRLSKVVRKERRSDLTNDGKLIELLGELEKQGHKAAGSSLVRSKIASELTGYKPPHWDHTTIPLKILVWSTLISEQGGRAFTLRLNTFLASHALDHHRGPAWVMHRRINTTLRKAFGAKDKPDFWLVVERDPMARSFHIHGGIEVPTDDGGLDGVRSALHAAGGEWASALHSDAQLDDRAITEPAAWASYVYKRFHKNKADLDASPCSATLSLRSRSEHRWAKLRADLLG